MTRLQPENLFRGHTKAIMSRYPLDMVPIFEKKAITFLVFCRTVSDN